MLFIFDKEFENFQNKSDITHEQQHQQQQQQQLEDIQDIVETPTNVITSNGVNGNGVDFGVDISSASSTASGSTSISADNTPPNDRHHLSNLIPQECSANCPNHYAKLPMLIKQHHHNNHIQRHTPIVESYRSLSDIFGRTFINGWFKFNPTILFQIFFIPLLFNLILLLCLFIY